MECVCEGGGGSKKSSRSRAGTLYNTKLLGRESDILCVHDGQSQAPWSGSMWERVISG